VKHESGGPSGDCGTTQFLDARGMSRSGPGKR
jgi:hypothetical protein